MRHTPRNQSVNVRAGGQNIHIQVDAGNINPQPNVAGAMGFLKGGHIPKNVDVAHTQRRPDRVGKSIPEARFCDPKRNVRHFGIREGMHVADFGAGSGAYTLALAPLVGATGVVYAVDVQRDLLTRIQNEAIKCGVENIEVVWSDMESEEGIYLKDELLDCALLSNVLFQLDNKIGVIKEAWRVLKTGATLVVIDWSESFGGLGPQKEAVVTPAEARLLCGDNGFVFRRQFEAGEHHYGLIFSKSVGNTEVAKDTAIADDFVSRTIAQELL